MKESKSMMRKEVAFMKKKGAPKSMVRHEEEEMGMKGKKVRKFSGQSGSYVSRGPSTREPTGPTSPRVTYVPNPFGKSIRVPLGPSGTSTPRQSTRNQLNMFGEENPNFNPAMREAEEETRRLEEMRRAKPPTQMAHGGKVKGAFRKAADGMAHKGKTKGKVVKMAGGGMAYSGGGSVFRKAADGIASKGKTKGKIVKMMMGGVCK